MIHRRSSSSLVSQPTKRLVRSSSMLEWNEIQVMARFEKDMDELSGSKNEIPKVKEDVDDVLKMVDDVLKMNTDPQARKQSSSPDCVADEPLQSPPSKEHDAQSTEVAYRRSNSESTSPPSERSSLLASILMPTIDETPLKPPHPKERKGAAQVSGFVPHPSSYDTLERRRQNIVKDKMTVRSCSTSRLSSSVRTSGSRHSWPKRSALKSRDSRASIRAENLNVSFSSLEIRSYPLTMGDTPTMNGCPVQLDWDYDPEATEEYTVDYYENFRIDTPRRSREEMIIPANRRQYLLMKQAGFSSAEIMSQMEIVKKDAERRKKTHRNLKYAGVDEAIEKTKRKFGKLRKIQVW